MKPMFEAPPADVEYNQRVEQHPDFARACRFTRILNGVGVAAFSLPLLKFVLEEANPQAFVFQLMVAFFTGVIPASIFLVYHFRGLVWYNVRMTVPHPSPFFGMFVAGISLTVAGSMHSFLDYGSLFLWAIPVAIVLWLAILSTTKEFNAYTKLDIGNMGAFLFVCYLFSFGAVMCTNCVFDQKETRVIQTIVTEKKILKSSDDRSYFVHFAPVAGIDDTKTEVHSSFFYSVEVNDPIRFNLKQGLWGIPWYYLEREN